MYAGVCPWRPVPSTLSDAPDAGAVVVRSGHVETPPPKIAAVGAAAEPRPMTSDALLNMSSKGTSAPSPEEALSSSFTIVFVNLSSSREGSNDRCRELPSPSPSATLSGI